MRVDGRDYRSIWPVEDGAAVEIIDQTRLPHAFHIVRLDSLADVAHAIRKMQLRGAPLIGAAAAYGLALALREDPTDAGLADARRVLLATRPTAVNLRWALDRMRSTIVTLPSPERAAAAWSLAAGICDEDVAINRGLAKHGLPLIENALAAKAGDGPLRILTHCNAGWLATVDHGTALAPVYAAHDAGLPVHVWVDETRPRNQGASLTAWELAAHGVPYTLIVDNAGGHLMRRGQVDLCLVGTDRCSAAGDVCNKIGTYLKALAARDCGVPFHVCAPSPSIDWSLREAEAMIEIEERDASEILWVSGPDEEGVQRRVRLAGESTPVCNPAFDVTPARLISGLLTERGACPATPEGLAALFPERASRTNSPPAAGSESAAGMEDASRNKSSTRTESVAQADASVNAKPSARAEDESSRED